MSFKNSDLEKFHIGYEYKEVVNEKVKMDREYYKLSIYRLLHLFFFKI